MSPSETSFYHSFPRPRGGDTRDDQIRVGLEILQSMHQIGLVLAPELLVWEQPLSDGSKRKIVTKQSRLCFTDLSRGELTEHAKKFGLFSIEISVDQLRRLGAMPAIYIPNQTHDDDEYGSVGLTVVAQLHDIRYTIGILHKLWRTTDPESILRDFSHLGAKSVAENATINLQNSISNGNIVQSKEIPLNHVKAVLDYIGFRNAPFELMENVLLFTQNLFYPTDDVRHDESLAYYRQREWKIVPGATLNGHMLTRAITESEKALLLKINRRFWSGTLTSDGVTKRRVDDAIVIDGMSEGGMSELLSAVIVPHEALDEARRLFGDLVQVSEES